MENKRILIIGQAPPAVKQELPYDTTMLYDWLREIGIGKEHALSLFDFDAVYNGEFLGFNPKGGHLKPTKQHMEAYWESTLASKTLGVEKIWIVGRVAEEFLKEKGIFVGMFGKEVITTIHPSKRNYSLYQRNKIPFLRSLVKFINT